LTGSSPERTAASIGSKHPTSSKPEKVWTRRSPGDTRTFVLTRRDLPRPRATIEFYSGDLARLVQEQLRPAFRSIWFVGGGAVSGECLRLGLADEVRYSIVPVLIGEGIPFFGGLDKDIALHLVEAKAYKNGMVALRHEVRK
jgi:dihydrofolate reductase